MSGNLSLLSIPSHQVIVSAVEAVAYHLVREPNLGVQSILAPDFSSDAIFLHKLWADACGFLISELLSDPPLRAILHAGEYVELNHFYGHEDDKFTQIAPSIYIKVSPEYLTENIDGEVGSFSPKGSLVYLMPEDCMSFEMLSSLTAQILSWRIADQWLQVVHHLSHTPYSDMVKSALKSLNGFLQEISVKKRTVTASRMRLKTYPF